MDEKDGGGAGSPTPRLTKEMRRLIKREFERVRKEETRARRREKRGRLRGDLGVVERYVVECSAHGHITLDIVDRLKKSLRIDVTYLRVADIQRARASEIELRGKELADANVPKRVEYAEPPRVRPKAVNLLWGDAAARAAKI